MDGDTLVATLTEGTDDDTQARAKDLHSRYYKEIRVVATTVARRT